MKDIKITSRSYINQKEDNLNYFFRDIYKYPLLTAEEEKKVCKLLKSEDTKEEAIDKLVKSNIRFVITVAKQYQGQGVLLSDLIMSGIEGLIESAHKFDPDRGYKFITFAVWYIRREVIKAIYNTGRTIRYPTSYICKLSKVTKAYDSFVNKNNREPNEKELLELTNLSQKQYQDVVNNQSYCTSIDLPAYDDSDSTVADLVPTSDIDPVSSTDNSIIKEKIYSLLSSFGKREKDIFRLFFGLDCAKMNPREIGELFGLVGERIRQLKNKVVEKIKKDKELNRIYNSL